MKTLSAFLILIFLSIPAWAQSNNRAFKKNEPRVALIIGNSDYKSSPLKNPVNDAKDMASVLEKKGFQVTLLTNADQRSMIEGARIFGKKLKKGGVGLFYYAGHGMQVRGRNYLIPTGANIDVEGDIEFEAVDVGRVLEKMDTAENRLNIVILDACRDNPFARSFRSSTKGLAQMDSPGGTLIAYATSPGKTAADGDGNNGLYTEYLLQQMAVPGMELAQMFKRVRAGVSKATNQQQIPWEASSVTGDFYFTPGKTSAVATPAPSTVSTSEQPSIGTALSNEEQEIWNIIQNSNNIRDFENFLRDFPNGQYARIATYALQKLKRKQAPKPAQTSGIQPAKSQPSFFRFWGGNNKGNQNSSPQDSGRAVGNGGGGGNGG
ncbi:MAG: caspase family protein, partial [SAR324 cluster bacterium]|nr:caspase family protein [SAR324 cluster bacterium]